MSEKISLDSSEVDKDTYTFRYTPRSYQSNKPFFTRSWCHFIC